MLQKYNGAILADAVGLGKTWSALAVIKFFQLQGREVLLLCP
jgi:SNF2 family DNA or RNA helicase